PGHHWKKSKQAAREMEQELGLKRPVSRRTIGIKLGKAVPKSKFYSPTSRPTKHYAGMLGEQSEIALRRKKKGEGKTDGSGGGAASTTSALKSSSKSNTPPEKKYSGSDIGKGNGPERRRKNMWVPVERRERRPK
ncbi:MAG: hypothetical protein WAO98_04540, partial [Alphaproteobacteria bacterium]